MTAPDRAIQISSNTDDSITQELPLETLRWSFERGKSNLANKEHENAIRQLTKARNELQSNALSIVLTRWIKAYLKAGKWEGAIRDAENAVQAAPEFPDTYIQLVSCYLSGDQVREAFICYVRAIKLVPTDNPCYDTILIRKHLLEDGIRHKNSVILHKVPREIFARILSYIRPKEYTKCIETCKDLAPERLELNWDVGAYPNLHCVKPKYIRYSLRKVELSADDPGLVEKVDFLISSGCCHIESIGWFCKCSRVGKRSFL